MDGRHEQGIRRTFNEARRADLILRLVAPDAERDPGLTGDMDSTPAEPPDGLDALTAYLAERAKRATGKAGDAVLTLLRHRREVETAHIHLRAFLDNPDDLIELRAENLRLVLSAIGRRRSSGQNL